MYSEFSEDGDERVLSMSSLATGIVVIIRDPKKRDYYKRRLNVSRYNRLKYLFGYAYKKIAMDLCHCGYAVVSLETDSGGILWINPQTYHPIAERSHDYERPISLATREFDHLTSQ